MGSCFDARVSKLVPACMTVVVAPSHFAVVMRTRIVLTSLRGASSWTASVLQHTGRPKQGGSGMRQFVGPGCVSTAAGQARRSSLRRCASFMRFKLFDVVVCAAGWPAMHHVV